jgi:hypothetical protein
MGSLSKSQPLEAYLASLDTPSSSSNPDPLSPKESSSLSSAGRVIILMILSQTGHPLSASVLKEHSELSPPQYKQTIHELLSGGLIQQCGEDYALTDMGEKVAQDERARLLMPR